MEKSNNKAFVDEIMNVEVKLFYLVQIIIIYSIFI